MSYDKNHPREEVYKGSRELCEEYQATKGTNSATTTSINNPLTQKVIDLTNSLEKNKGLLVPAMEELCQEELRLTKELAEILDKKEVLKVTLRRSIHI